MQDPSNPALPNLGTAPFWTAITPEEFGAFVGDPPRPGDLDFTPGWTLAAYGVQLDTVERVTILGWVRGPFGVADADNGTDEPWGHLYHLPTGRLVGTFATAELAAFAAAVVEPLADWPTLTALRVGDLPQRFCVLLSDVGFHHAVMPTEDRMIPVWFRDIGDLN